MRSTLPRSAALKHEKVIFGAARKRAARNREHPLPNYLPI